MADIARLQIAVEPKGVNEATDMLKSMSNAADAVEGAVKKVAAAWASWKIVQAAKEAAMLAARYETLGVVMGVLGNNAGYTAAEMVQFQNALMKTGISAIESRNTLNMMASAQMDLTKSAQLARVAQDAAVIGNMNSSEAFQRMIYGIQSGQTEILRTIGINVNFENSYKALAKELKKNVADLTEQEKVQARMNVVLAKGKDIAGAYEASMGTVSKQLASSKRYVEDLQVSVGGLFGGVALVAVTEYTNALKQAQEYMAQHKIEAEATKGLLQGTAQNAADIVKNMMELASASGQVAGDFTLMELGAGALLAVSAILKDAWNVIAGSVMTVASGFTTIVSGAANLLTLGKSKGTSDWYNYNLDWAEKAQRQLGSGLNADAIRQAMNGGPETKTQAGMTLEQEKARIAAMKEAREEAARKAKAEADAKRNAEQAAKELERQLGFMRGLRDELEKSVYTEDELLQIRIKRANLSPAMEREAQALAKLIQMSKDLVPNDEKLVQAIQKFDELQLKMADVRPGVQDSVSALLLQQASDRQTEANRNYNRQGFAREELNRLKAERDMYDPDVYRKKLADLRIEASNTWAFMADSFDIATSHMGDALTQLTMKGKASWRELTNAMLADVIRMSSNRAFSSLFGMLMGLGGGGEGVSTSTSLNLPNPTPVPTGGGIGDVIVPARGVSGGVSVVVNMNNQGATVDAQGGGAIGKKMGEAMRAAAMDVLRSESNPGGFLYKRGNA